MLQAITSSLYALWVNYGPYVVFLAISRLLYGLLTRNSVKSVENEVVLITGASSGIGESVAKELYLKGAKLILAARRLQELHRVKDELISLSSPGSLRPAPKILVLDVADIKSIDSKMEEAFSMFGRIDVIIHNAGILSRAEVAESNMDVYKDVMQVNYFGVVGLTLATLPRMVQSKKGHIVAISSVQGRISIPRRSAYAASKHALVAFMDSLRAEVANSGVSVTCIHPGYVKTNIAHASLTARGRAYGRPDPNIQSGYEADYVTKKICKAIESGNPDLIIAPFVPNFLIVLRTLCPNFYFFIMKRIAKSEQYY